MSPPGSQPSRFIAIGGAVLVTILLIGLALIARPVAIDPSIDETQDHAQRVGASSAEVRGTRVELPDRAPAPSPTAKPGDSSGIDTPTEEIDADDAYADLLLQFAGRRLAFQGEKRAMPPDPVDTGGAELFLRLIDSATDRPIASTVQLWHLDAPASETWSAGDQQQHRVHIPVQGYRFTDLAHGRYRAFVHAEGRSADGQAAFEVFGLHQKIDLRVTMPQRFAIHLAIYRLDGTRIQRAALRHWDSGISWSRHPKPAWAGRRSPELRRDGVFVISETIGTSDQSQPPALEWSVAEARGFRIGPILENKRDETRFYLVEVEASPLVGPTSFKYEPDVNRRRFVSVAVEPMIVLRSLRLPGGGDASHASDEVSIRPQVLALGTGAGGDRWRDVPVLVHVQIAGHEPLEFRFTPRDVPLAPRQLKLSK